MMVTEILDDLLKQVPDEYDTSEGSFFYDLLYPVASEIQVLYNKIDVLESNAFALTAIGEFLDRKVAEQGIYRNAATFAKGTLRITGKPGAVVLQGAKAASDSMLYAVDETTEIPDTGVVDVTATCIMEGSAGNAKVGTITRFPVTLPELSDVTNITAFTGGYDSESDADLLNRYIEKVSRPNVSGNRYHYIGWAKEIAGVGNVTVISLWNGPGTVKVIITDSDNQPAGDDLVAAVKEHIEKNRPIGADVTVESAEALAINISVKVASNVKDTLQKTIESAIYKYLSEVSLNKTYVSYAKIGSLILSISGVDDYSELTVNGAADNILLDEGTIPVLGSVTIT